VALQFRRSVGILGLLCSKYYMIAHAFFLQYIYVGLFSLPVLFQIRCQPSFIFISIIGSRLTFSHSHLLLVHSSWVIHHTDLISFRVISSAIHALPTEYIHYLSYSDTCFLSFTTMTATDGPAHLLSLKVMRLSVGCYLSLNIVGPLDSMNTLKAT
jgi:hypothetical protein